MAGLFFLSEPPAVLRHPSLHPLSHNNPAAIVTYNSETHVSVGI